MIINKTIWHVFFSFCVFVLFSNNIGYSQSAEEIRNLYPYIDFRSLCDSLSSNGIKYKGQRNSFVLISDNDFVIKWNFRNNGLLAFCYVDNRDGTEFFLKYGKGELGVIDVKLDGKTIRSYERNEEGIYERVRLSLD